MESFRSLIPLRSIVEGPGLIGKETNQCDRLRKKVEEGESVGSQS